MKHRLDTIHDRIRRACDAASRDPAEVTLVAVSKTQRPDAIKAAMDLGLTHFGENRVQEAQEKWPGLLQSGVKLHMIGPLQTNKVKQASALFDTLHTLDRPTLAAAMTAANWHPPCFVQVNIGEEPQKSGVAPADLAAFLQTLSFPIQGLMCIPPYGDMPVPHFTLLKNLAVRHGLSRLSMGMSGDFEAAIRCGATHIRVGSALFGDRV